MTDAPATNTRQPPSLALLTAAFAACALSAVAAAGAATPALYQNCTNFNKKYPHGVGKLAARDHTSGVPVTTFKRSTRLYRVAMSYNKGSTATATRSPARNGD